LVALAGMAYRDFSKHRVVIAGYVAYLLVFMFVGSGNYAWYTIPFLPFLVIAMAVFVWDLITRPDIFKIAIFLALPFASSFYWGYVVFKSGNVINIYRGIIGLFLIAGATTLIKSTFFKNEILKKILQKKILWIVFVILIGYQINKWNWQSFLYITANWSRLPESFQIK